MKPDSNGNTLVFRQESKITLNQREDRNRQKAHVLWLTGLSGAGKSTIACETEKALFNSGHHVYLLDGDNIRSGLNRDLTFTEEDRKENIRRIGHMARLMYDAGIIVICAFISPSREMRRYVRDLFPVGRFSEIFINCDIQICRERDVKGLYSKADRGEIPNFTGISSPYDIPENPELILNTAGETPAESVNRLLKYITERIQTDHDR
jgi:adenylylsulfate kinase